ncbi:hypothetical protein M2171_005555 [Bradyrhizobium japonicum USDA 38]|uniref:hypothetical protein n=1 Tax=Bradyrhizobium japonicum TaxID=375 RepID=UPI000419A9B2|nr:hypothetical protein [Bradyrhizobium japonicum]MCS3896422.1 hypothetical protein [Bradyrhizobium japonicum USDA 38]MCS3948936.1 hypothetical protein [Bradyrhizobium japonicum]
MAAIHNGRIHIEKINGAFLSNDGCNGSGIEVGAGIKYAIKREWLDCTRAGSLSGWSTPAQKRPQQKTKLPGPFGGYLGGNGVARWS